MRVCVAKVMLVMGAPFGFGVRVKKSKQAKGVIIKRTVGALESIFGAPFWANRKSADPASAENSKFV